MNAQESRGVDFKGGRFSEKIRAIVSLMVPLFVTAFTLSEDLSFAMEARGYDPSAKRTRYRVMKFRLRDLFSFIFILACLTGSIFLLVFHVDFAPFIVDLFNLIKGLFKWLNGLKL